MKQFLIGLGAVCAVGNIYIGIHYDTVPGFVQICFGLYVALDVVDAIVRGQK